MATTNGAALDHALAALRDRQAPDGLALIDDGVITGFQAHIRDRAAARRSLSLACAVAVVVGAGSTIAFPARQARADTSLLAMPASAPSRLLGE